jgi:hypothetical protein
MNPVRAVLPVLLILAGCSLLTTDPPATTGVRFPTGDALAGFGVAERCAPTVVACATEVQRQLLDLAANLETPYGGPGVVDPAQPFLPGTLTAVYSGAAAFTWGAADGTSGTATAIAVDLAPLLRESVAYAVLATPDGIIRYALPLGQAFQLLETLYVVRP